jgi:signal transduction histidine kinase
MVASGYYLIDNIAFYLFVIAALQAQAVYTWQFRKMPGALMAVLSQTCKAAWLLFLVFASLSIDLSDKIFWIKLQKMTGVLLPYLWLLFTLKISQQENIIPRGVKRGIFGCVIVLWFALLTNWQGLSWQDARFEAQAVWFVYGPVPWIALAFGYVLAIVNTFLSFRWFRTSFGLRRKQALWYIAAISISWLFHILWFVEAFRISALPLGFLVSGMIISWIYYRWQFYNILPLAHAVIVKDMVDGLLIVDEYGYVVEINPAAKTMFPEHPAGIGCKFEKLATDWPILLENVRKSEMQSIEVSRQHLTGMRHYHLNVTALKTPGGYMLGKVIVFKDITQQKLAQETTMHQQKAMSILIERDRLGREIHDTQGQFPGYVKNQAQAIRLNLQNQRLPEAIEQLTQLIKASDIAFTDVRESITGLKTPADGWNFFGKLQEWLSQFQKTSGIPCVYNGPLSAPQSWISAEAEVELLRIIQESLSNTRKHSAASSAQVRFDVNTRCVRATVTDDGCGFNLKTAQTDPAKFGLKIIQERTVGIGGTFILHTAPGQGTVVAVEIPLRTIA